MNFDLLRLVLVSRDQVSLFEKRDNDASEFSRESWIRHLLTQDLNFVYRKKTYFYIFQEIQKNFITAKVGRSRIAVENTPPENGFIKEEREKWLVSSIVVDPRHGEDGQKVAFEHNSDLGQSVGLMRALFEEANAQKDSPFIVEANAILDPQSFWDFEKANRGKIHSVSFELIAPNMFGVREAIDKEMAEFRDNEKAVSATITLKNPNGLQLETERVAQTVAYASEGGGSIQAKAKGRKTYRSEEKAKKITLPEIKEIEFETFSSMIGRVISGIFENE